MIFSVIRIPAAAGAASCVARAGIDWLAAPQLRLVLQPGYAAARPPLDALLCRCRPPRGTKPD
jgi:hypothetical protein